MKVSVPNRLDKASFYRWLDSQPPDSLKCELKDGRIVQQMTRTTKAHNRIVSNFIRILTSQLDLDAWSVTSCELAVEIGEDVRLPDIIVERLTPSGNAMVAAAPILLVEVLSPSSTGTDMTLKLSEYMSLPTLRAYIVASQHEPICWIWQRDTVTGDFPTASLEVKGADATIALANPALTLPLAELYRSAFIV